MITTRNHQPTGSLGDLRHEGPFDDLESSRSKREPEENGVWEYLRRTWGPQAEAGRRVYERRLRPVVEEGRGWLDDPAWMAAMAVNAPNYQAVRVVAYGKPVGESLVDGLGALQPQVVLSETASAVAGMGRTLAQANACLTGCFGRTADLLSDDPDRVESALDASVDTIEAQRVLVATLLMMVLTDGAGASRGVTRPLTAADLGLPEDAIVQGKFSVRGAKATVKVDYLGAGKTSLGSKLFGSRGSLMSMAKEAGATTLRIETSPIIEETGLLQRALQRAGFQQRPNGTMWWEGTAQ